MKAPDGPSAALSERTRDAAFSEPWQAQAQALVEQLVARGVLGVEEWSQALGREVRQARESGRPDDLENHYLCVLAALERLSQRKNLVASGELEDRKAAWRDAFETTPHGKPVTLGKV